MASRNKTSLVASLRPGTRRKLPFVILALVVALASGCAVGSHHVEVGHESSAHHQDAHHSISPSTGGTYAEGSGLETAIANVPAQIPVYDGEPYVELNGGTPDFTADELALPSFESYAPLDSLGRSVCGFAMVSDETRPANNERRGNISNIKPTGWRQGFYDFIVGESLYNRSHLIAWSLSAENDNPCNLMTGTIYMNQDNMEPFESQILAYIRNTGNHVLIRSTPVFEGTDLLAKGIHYEAYSVEDDGGTICFNVFLFNVQPGVEIDNATGANWEE